MRVTNCNGQTYVDHGLGWADPALGLRMGPMMMSAPAMTAPISVVSAAANLPPFHPSVLPSVTWPEDMCGGRSSGYSYTHQFDYSGAKGAEPGGMCCKNVGDDIACHGYDKNKDKTCSSVSPAPGCSK